MPPRSWPNPQERFAAEYRRAHEAWDEEPIGHYERAGFGYTEGFRGAYAERPEYYLPRGQLHPPEPEGSSWPRPVWTLSAEAEERHLRALVDRDLARSVDFALYNVIGRDADRMAVYASDGRITLAGALPHRWAARRALEVARAVPGVRAVRSELWVPRGY